MLPRIVWAAAAWFLVASVSTSAAQQQLVFFNGLKGKVKAVSGDIIQWTDGTGAEMYVQVDKNSKTQLLGEVEPGFLGVGMFVRFSAEVTKRGKVVSDIDELTIFSPADGFSPGVFEDGPVDPKAASARYLISGQITANKNGQLTVDAGELTFRANLDKDAKLKIDVSDYTLARADDEIVITGSGEDKTRIKAKGVEIQLATPLQGAEEKKPRRPAPAKRPAR